MACGSTNLDKRKLISSLKKQNRPIWKRVAEDLSKPARQRREINLSRLNRFTKDGDVVIVPGVVLGDGAIEHKITIAAFRFSKAAKERILKAGGEIYTIEEFVEKNADAKGVKLLG